MLKLQELYNLKAFDYDFTADFFLVDPLQMTNLTSKTCSVQGANWKLLTVIPCNVLTFTLFKILPILRI